VYLLLEFFNRHSQNLARAGIILLVVLATVSIADAVLFTIDVVTRQPAPTPSDPSRSTAGARAIAPQVSIAEFNLFGATQNVPAIAASAVDVPETKLNLTLEGVFTSDGKSGSTAIVADAKQPGELYHIGDTLPGKVILSAVYDDHIVIQRGTRYETLRFSEEALLGSSMEVDEADLPQGDVMPEEPMGIVSDDEDPDQPVRRARRVSPRAPSQSNATPAGQGSIGELVDSYRDRLRADPDGLLAELGVEPVESGGTAGYRLGNELSAQQLQQAGLMPGDVVLSVNGQPVGAVMQDQALIDAAIASGRVRVEIQRQDRRFFITVPVH
jgi:general secretion pathway protein C